MEWLQHRIEISFYLYSVYLNANSSDGISFMSFRINIFIRSKFLVLQNYNFFIEISELSNFVGNFWAHEVQIILSQ